MYWLGRYLNLVTLTYILAAVTDIIYVNVPDLLKCKTSNHQTLHSASPRCTDSAGLLTQWPWPIFCTPVPFTHFTLTFNIFSSIRPTTTKRCLELLLNVRTLQVAWLGDLDLYFMLHWLLHFLHCPSYVLNYKAFSHQTLYTAPSQCTDLAGTLTWWPWPIFCSPVPLTHFTLMFDISSNIRPTTTKPCIVLHLIVLTWQVPWPGDLDLYLTHCTLMFDNSLVIRPTTTISYIVLLLDVLIWQVPWPGDLDLYFMLQWHILHWHFIIIGLYNTKSQCWSYSH